jgi:DNA helicase-2/ATP-dependent DNA helicase PcrA
VRLALLRARIPHATSLAAPAESAPVVALVEALRGMPPTTLPFPALSELRAARRWRRADGDDTLGDEEHLALDALLGWSVRHRTAAELIAGSDRARGTLTALTDAEAPIELVTVHGAKGREWPLVVIVGFEEERFPNRRALVDAREPRRALEEERRLAYVALTRATRRLVLAFDPARPSRVLAEMGYSPTSGATIVR